MTLHLDEEDFQIVMKILQNGARGLEVLAFGSRVTGKHLKKFSDLDLALKAKNGEKISGEIMSDLRDKFEESNLPIKVDILDLSSVNAKFANIIKENYEVIQ